MIISNALKTHDISCPSTPAVTSIIKPWRDGEKCAPPARREEEEEEECGRKEEDHLTDDKEEEMEDDARSCCFSGDDGGNPGEARGVEV